MVAPYGKLSMMISDDLSSPNKLKMERGKLVLTCSAQYCHCLCDLFKTYIVLLKNITLAFMDSTHILLPAPFLIRVINYIIFKSGCNTDV